MFAFTYAQVFAATDISAEVVFILPNFRRNQPLFGGASRYCPLFSRPLLSQRVLYTTAPETVMLPLHHQPMARGSYGLLALDFTLMTVLATHASSSFPPRWSGILESNQEPQSYQDCALTDCANARKLPLCQSQPYQVDCVISFKYSSAKARNSSSSA